MLITVNVQIFIITILFILTKQIKIYSVLMFFTLLHELAHMCMGMALRLKPKELKINPFGISILFETYERKEIKKILIALSGPLLNLAIAIIFCFMNINTELKEIIVYSNILIGAFNLIPIYPVDGGRILKSILRRNFTFIETEKFLNIVSNTMVIILTALSSIVILIYHNIGILLVLIYLWILNIKENKRYVLKKRVYEAIESANSQKSLDKKVENK